MIDEISEDVMMHLINAIYFKGDWTHRFCESATRDEMGMSLAFTSQADFSGIASGISISRVLHKAVIEVNEKGSEAAAVTAAEITKGAAPEPLEFIVNRPFLFAIADDRTGSILFMGKVAEP